MRAGKIFKYIFIALFTVFFGFLLIRIFMLEDKRELSDVYPTDGACAAYRDVGDGAFLTHKTADEISADGYFGAYGICYIEASEELQITVRYNDSLYERYLEGSDPNLYRWELRDGEGNVLSKGEVLEKSEKYRYNYVRLAFDGIEIGKDSELILQLICDECSYPDADNEGFAVHTPSMKFARYKLSAREIEGLNG